MYNPMKQSVYFKIRLLERVLKRPERYPFINKRLVVSKLDQLWREKILSDIAWIKTETATLY